MKLKTLIAFLAATLDHLHKTTLKKVTSRFRKKQAFLIIVTRFTVFSAKTNHNLTILNLYVLYVFLIAVIKDA